MVQTDAVALLVGSFVLALALVALVAKLADRMALLAEPNERSSHQVAKPTIGGIAIVIPALGCLATAALQGEGIALGVLLGGAGLALLGLLDDLLDLGAGVRFFCQILAVIVVVYSLSLEFSVLMLAAVGFVLLWQVNLFNFMDGIDGIAATQVLIFGIGTQILGGGVSGWAGELELVLIGSTLGFLAFNWPPARIFMGDVGSLFLGLVTGVLAIELADSGRVPLVASIVLLTGFWFDATYTLCVRMVTQQKFTQAHRSHLYQRLTDRIGHLRTTLLFAAMGFGWLLTLARLAIEYPDWSLLIVLLAVLPYLTGAIVLRAGLPASRSEVS